MLISQTEADDDIIKALHWIKELDFRGHSIRTHLKFRGLGVIPYKLIENVEIPQKTKKKKKIGLTPQPCHELLWYLKICDSEDEPKKVLLQNCHNFWSICTTNLKFGMLSWNSLRSLYEFFQQNLRWSYWRAQGKLVWNDSILDFFFHLKGMLLVYTT